MCLQDAAYACRRAGTRGRTHISAPVHRRWRAESETRPIGASVLSRSGAGKPWTPGTSPIPKTSLEEVHPLLTLDGLRGLASGARGFPSLSPPTIMHPQHRTAASGGGVLECLQGPEQVRLRGANAEFKRSSQRSGPSGYKGGKRTTIDLKSSGHAEQGLA
uniref:Uncharacterized protein n=1 Tax=Molossus molossus TaxID=27622 RepID=A0A7J8JWE4_MOLMO|nr:hypothetical protein HJG59_007841 [Molossus molossus]